PGTSIENDNTRRLVEFIAMCRGIGPGPDLSLLFARKQDEAYGSAWLQPRGLDRTQRVNHQRGVAAVVERACSQFPGIQVRAQHHELVRLLVAANFRYYVPRLNGTANFVGN